MNSFFDDTRKVLAYFWSLASAIFIAYILYRWGNEKEILTLIIGLISGLILGGIFGVYFGSNHHPKAAVPPDGGVATTERTTTTTIQSPPL